MKGKGGINVKRNFIWGLAGLIVIALLGVSSVGRAQVDKWKRKADMPTARAWLSTGVVNGKIYAIGGTNRPPAQIPAPITLTVEEYDPATDTWTTKANMPTARAAFSTSVVNGKIYVIGGDAPHLEPLTSTVEEYDPATDTWTTKADMPTDRIHT